MVSRGLLLALLPGAAVADGNGLARLPPMGWRSWNLFGLNVSQNFLEGITARKRTVNDVPASLCDLGYRDVGLDDGWQDCDAGEGDNNYHDADGNPVIDSDRFPRFSPFLGLRE